MNIPEELKYSKTHEWVKMLDETTCQIGITDYAQSELGDLVFINLPKPGDKVEANAVFCDVESVKAVSDVISPVSGTISAVNEALTNAPEKLNEDPFGAWIARIADITATDELMDAAEYKVFCAAQEA